MTLTPGSRIGAYEIVAAIGAGGMGEVYRAHDPKLRRDVAIKVLPDLFARDPERLARFEREARTLALLNHPHVAQVYGVEGGALVMEFVEGEDLAQRIARAGAIPLEEALPIALQIAEALEAAHEQGIIHRDLKPANIKVRSDGNVKVLDFGLAKAVGVDHDGPVAELANSPTITSPFAMSNLGVILGTAAYMAPEQAKGKPLDKRVDIWAFGCVLYEMLTGRRPFDGEDVTDTLAAIVRGDPDWSALPANTPATVRTLLRRCLEKDRRERLPDIGAARLELKEARATDVAEAGVVKPPAAASAVVPWIVAAVAILGAIVAGTYALLTRPAPDTRVFKSVIVPPSPLSGAPALRLAISPDGRRLAFVAPDAAGTTMLWVRPLDSTVPQPLAGTTNARAPFWSPDSRSLAFIADGRLRRIDAAGGPILTICNALDTPPGTWNRDDVIVFSGFRGPLARVYASGGAPVAVTELTPGIGERIQHMPFFLPDGRHFLYTAGTGGSRSLGIYVGSLDTKKTVPLLTAGSNAAYANGYLLYLRDTTLMAQRIDPDSLKLSGDPVPVATDVQINTSTGTGAFSVSQTGVLVYQTGPSSGTLLVWHDRAGKQLGSVGTQAGNRDVQLSPDGRWASVTLPNNSTQQPDIWRFDLARGLSKRLTFGGSGSMDAVWSPDGRRVAYASRPKKVLDIFQRNVSGIGTEELLLEDDVDKYPLGFTRDGKFLLYFVPTGAATGHVWLLPMSGDRKPRPFNHTKDSEVPAEVSPDGRWIAYVSDENGRREVYVTSFPDATGKWQVSTTGGENPRWRSDGKEMFFTAGDRLVAVDVQTTGAQFDVGGLHPLFDVRVPPPALGTRSTYAASQDGQRFLFNMWDPKAAFAPITVVVNWPEVVKK
jgi:Tol biopolymer transport system component/predicted Ser/Thr protein kinase